MIEMTQFEQVCWWSIPMWVHLSICCGVAVICFYLGYLVKAKRNRAPVVPSNGWQLQHYSWYNAALRDKRR